MHTNPSSWMYQQQPPMQHHQGQPQTVTYVTYSSMPPPQGGMPPPPGTSYVTYGPGPSYGGPHPQHSGYGSYGPPPQPQYQYGPMPGYAPFPHQQSWPNQQPPMMRPDGFPQQALSLGQHQASRPMNPNAASFSTRSTHQPPQHQQPSGHDDRASKTSGSSGTGSSGSNPYALARANGTAPPPPPWEEAGKKPFHQKKMSELGIKFIPFPKTEDYKRAPTGKSNYHRCEHALFLGQLHYDCTLDMVLWIIELLSDGKCVPVHLHRRGAGCAMAYFEDADQAALVRSKNGWALFDYTGLWVAQDAEQAERMQEYARGMRQILKAAHLPGDCVVVRL